MKKSIVFLLAVLVALGAVAQSKEHMKFMGIPMGLTINTFQNRLAVKGVKYDDWSKYLSNGTRMFNGLFAGQKSSIYIYYDASSKKVYRAKVVIDRNDKPQVEQLFDEFFAMYQEKYGEDAFITTPIDDDLGFKTSSVYTALGRIDLFIREADADYITHSKKYYNLHIDYFDSAAESENKSNRLDDL